MARPPKYDWTSLFDGVVGSRMPTTTLPGYDFDCSPESWRKQVLVAARRRGFHVTTELKPDGSVVVRPRGNQMRDWDHIFDGRLHYWDPSMMKVELDGFRVTISRQARARDVTYRTAVRPANGFFYVQALTRAGIHVQVPTADQPVPCPHWG